MRKAFDGSEVQSWPSPRFNPLIVFIFYFGFFSQRLLGQAKRHPVTLKVDAKIS